MLTLGGCTLQWIIAARYLPLRAGWRHLTATNYPLHHLPEPPAVRCNSGMKAIQSGLHAEYVQDHIAQAQD
jgi:hypothetical protein